MAYFANGTEGDWFEGAWCSRCLHGQDEDPCAIMLLHLEWNGDRVDCAGTDDTNRTQREDRQYACDLFIPPDDQGCQQCVMFAPMTTEQRREKREAARQRQRERELAEARR